MALNLDKSNQSAQQQQQQQQASKQATRTALFTLSQVGYALTPWKMHRRLRVAYIAHDLQVPVIGKHAVNSIIERRNTETPCTQTPPKVQ